MSKKSGFLWECECGHTEYGTNPPEECGSCSSVSSFTQVPEDEIEERERKAILQKNNEEDMEDED